MSTAARVPETFELTGDDARETLAHVGRGRLLRDAFQRMPRGRRLQPRALDRVPRQPRPRAVHDRARRHRERGRRARRWARDRRDVPRHVPGTGRARADHLGAAGASRGDLRAQRRHRVRARRRPDRGHDPVRSDGARPQPSLRHRAGPPDGAEVRTGARARAHRRPAERRRRSSRSRSAGRWATSSATRRPCGWCCDGRSGSALAAAAMALLFTVCPAATTSPHGRGWPSVPRCRWCSGRS